MRYIFNTNGEYVAFILNNQLFSSNCNWLGIVINNKVYDTVGNFLGEVSIDDRIIRNKNVIESKIMRPMRPMMRPIRPMRPLRRLKMPSLLPSYEDVFYNNKGFETKTYIYENIENMNYLLGAKIVAYDGTFLGIISDNRFDSESVLNKYGVFGSEYSQTSIFNNYGQYGGKYSPYSPFNNYTITPPQVIMDIKVIGYLTTNTKLNPIIDANKFKNWISSL